MPAPAPPPVAQDTEEPTVVFREVFDLPAPTPSAAPGRYDATGALSMPGQAQLGGPAGRADLSGTIAFEDVLMAPGAPASAAPPVPPSPAPPKKTTSQRVAPPLTETTAAPQPDSPTWGGKSASKRLPAVTPETAAPASPAGAPPAAEPAKPRPFSAISQVSSATSSKRVFVLSEGDAAIAPAEPEAPPESKISTTSSKRLAKAEAPKRGRCPACDGLQDSAYAYGGREFCSLCKPVIETVVGEAKAAVAPGAVCSSCKKPAGPEALALGEQTICASCTQVSMELILARVRQRRGARPKGARASGSLLVPALGIVATIVLAVFLARNVPSFFHIDTAKQVPLPPPPPTPLGNQLLGQAKAIVDTPVRTYPEAVKAQDDVANLVQQATAADASLAPAGDVFNAKAKAAVERFAPGIEDHIMAQVLELTKVGHEDYAGAGKILETFPANLLSTPSGQRISAAKGRYAALASLEGPARRLLTGPESKDPPNVLLPKIQSLLDTPAAKQGKFAETELGKALIGKKRFLQNQLGGPQTPTNTVDPKLEMLRGISLEKKSNWAEAAVAYKNVLEVDRDNVDALVALARCQMLRDLPGIARDAAKRANTFAPNRPDVVVIMAWYDVLAGARDRAYTSLKAVPEEKRGILGHRLEKVLSLGMVRYSARQVRVMSPRVLDEKAMAPAIEELAVLVDSLEEALALPADDKPVTLYLFQDDAEAKSFATDMGTSPTPEGYIICGFGVAGTAEKLPLLRSALAQLLLRRSSTILPGWVRLALPLVAAEKSQAAAKAEDVDKLEKMSKGSLTKQENIDTARALASILYTKAGAHALGEYVAHQYDPTKARQELEAFLRLKKR
jgi:hypothetical protein